LDDAQLIQATLGGDEQAFKTLVQRYESRVAATVFGMLGKCPEAEDVGQETFIRFYHSLENFRGESGVGTYLTRIAINLSLNELKRRKRRSLIFFRKQDGEQWDIEDETANRPAGGGKEIVQRAIQELDPQYRAVIVLRLLEGYSTEETAQVLNVPLGTVLSRLSRGQQRLKQLLEPYMGELI